MCEKLAKQNQSPRRQPGVKSSERKHLSRVQNVLFGCGCSRLEFLREAEQQSRQTRPNLFTKGRKTPKPCHILALSHVSN